MPKKTQKAKQIINKKKSLITCGVLAGLLVLCALIGAIYNSTPGGKAAATARSLTEIAKLSATTIPSKTVKPTITNTPANTQTLTPSPSLTFTIGPRPTDTRWPTATNGPITRGSGSSCSCGANMDCPDFQTHAEAQACFESCGGSASYNWSNLDANHDGLACENLP